MSHWRTRRDVEDARDLGRVLGWTAALLLLGAVVNMVAILFGAGQ